MNILFLIGLAVGMAVCTEVTNQILEEFAVGRTEYIGNLYKEIVKVHTGNFLICPISIQTIFGLVNGGARGNTSKEIVDTLHLPSEDKINATFLKLFRSFQSTPKYNLSIANNAYIAKDFQIKPQFQTSSIEVFHSEIAAVDFTKPHEAASLINKWIEIQTQAKITHLLDENTLDPATQVVLVNALYFQGKWMKQFGNLITKPFHIDKSTTVNTKMMAISDDFNYYESPELNATFIELPYEGNDITMTIVLPHEIEGLGGLEQKVAEVLVTPKYNKTVRTNVYIPKFKMECTTHLAPVLRELGIIEAFTSDADFSGISEDEGFYIYEAIQKVYMEVDEKGTTAAAASAVVFARTGRFNEFYFTADRPFLFYLKHRINGVLFIGRFSVPVNQPDTE